MAGKIVHFELPAGDVDRASGFWNGLFGWDIGAQHDGGVRLPHVPDRRRPGRRRDAVRDTGHRSDRLLRHRRHRRVDREGRASSAATADDKQPVPTHGWFAACKDTEGNELQPLAGRRERRVTGVAVALAVLAGLAGSVQVAVMGRFGGADRRRRGADVRDGGPARALGRDPARGPRRARRPRRRVGDTPAWMWLGGLMGLTVVVVDHVRPAADRRDRDDRDPDRGPARDGRRDRPLRPLRGRADRDLAAAGDRDRAAGNRRSALARSVGGVEEREGLDRARHGLRDLGLDVPRHRATPARRFRRSSRPRRASSPPGR